MPEYDVAFYDKNHEIVGDERRLVVANTVLDAILLAAECLAKTQGWLHVVEIHVEEIRDEE